MWFWVWGGWVGSQNHWLEGNLEMRNINKINCEKEKPMKDNETAIIFVGN